MCQFDETKIWDWEKNEIEHAQIAKETQAKFPSTQVTTMEIKMNLNLTWKIKLRLQINIELKINKK